MRHGVFILALAGALALTGCADFPGLEATMSDRARAAPYPRILPLDSLLAAVPPVTSQSAGLGTLPGRLARLRANARALRGRPVLDPATRARLQAALARHP